MTQPPYPPAAAPPAPPPPAAYAPPAQRPGGPGGGGSRRTLILFIGGGVALGVIVLLVLIAATGGTAPQGNQGLGPGGVPSPGVPGEDGAIPAEGPDVFLAGGVATVPVPEGWRLLSRADVPTGVGGHPEATVLLQEATGVTFAAYVLGPDPAFAGGVAGVADSHARGWTKDGQDVQVDAAQGGPVAGRVVAAGIVRYRFALRGRALEGELLLAVRDDGYGLFVFADAPAGALEGARGSWGALRDAVVGTFDG